MPSNVYDSITLLPPQAHDTAVLAASHCGVYSARCAIGAGLSGVVLHDAGVGREQAGIAGLRELERHSLPAAAISHRSARIGDGMDCHTRGSISFVNESAARLGVSVGQHASDALALLNAAPPRQQSQSALQAVESRRLITRIGGVAVVALDSSSLVTLADSATIVMTGSHGGLLGGRATSAIKHRVLAAAYNDADLGIDEAGVSRLAALNALGVCAFTVSAWSARIGDGLSTYEEGFVTWANIKARDCGAEPGLPAHRLVERFIETWQSRHIS
jgi:hypothetical protein